MMVWIRRAPARHTCEPPTVGNYSPCPDGQLGDLWRCDECDELWRVGLACAWCDRSGEGPHQGQHAVGASWRPARTWQRIRHSKIFRRTS